MARLNSNVPTPSYPNDPTDPLRYSNEPVPDVPGMTITQIKIPEDPTMILQFLTKDPVKAGLTVQYIDQDDNSVINQMQ